MKNRGILEEAARKKGRGKERTYPLTPLDRASPGKRKESREKGRKRKSTSKLVDKENLAGNRECEELFLPQTMPVRLFRGKCKSIANSLLGRHSCERLSNERKPSREQSRPRKRPKPQKPPQPKSQLGNTQKLKLGKKPKKKSEGEGSKNVSGRRHKKAPASRSPSQGELLIKQLCDEDISSKLSEKAVRPEPPFFLSKELDEDLFWDLKDDKDCPQDADLVRRVVKIQSAWRSYKVRKILLEYENILGAREESQDFMPSEGEYSRLQPGDLTTPRPSHCVEEASSNVQQHSLSNAKDAIRRMKEVEVEKWREMTELIRNFTAREASMNTKELLQILALQS
jgi:hypothetical protein